ncbi:hypothetical protein QMZ05_26540 [Bradyrhizobium sp. INPA03-11B]|uniref:hypothetical protein n=1 Tax=Bradyrhizobium sp. INPA03-11B TaxID=418598 RepID=UPI00339023B3
MTVAEDIRGARKAGTDYGGFACCCSATKWQYNALAPVCRRLVDKGRLRRRKGGPWRIHLLPADASKHSAADVTTRAPSFKVLIAAELARIEAQLASTPRGPEREALESKLRRFKTAFNVDSWDRPT